VRRRLGNPDFASHHHEALTRLLEHGPHPHLAGQNDRGWTADLEWFLTAKALRKILDGAWDRPEPRDTGPTDAELARMNPLEADLIRAERERSGR
jgi:hypothetical protein